MEVRAVRIVDAEVAPLLAGLAEEYGRRYGANDELATTSEEDFDPPAGRFLVLVADDGTTVAGGGFRRIDDRACEVKRMWTHPEHRRRGYAARVLTALEEAAAAAGYEELRLETGPAQPEAEALYVRRGYERIPVFGPYSRALAFRTRLGGQPGNAPTASPHAPQ